MRLIRLGALAAGALAAAAQPAPSQRVSRDRWQRVPEVLEALAVGPGSSVADVGAGQGFYTTRLSRLVGSGGRVFAVDIAPDALSSLGAIARTAEHRNVTVVAGREDDPDLPRDSLDAVLIVNAYHEMTQYGPMLARLFSSLKPGGRIVLLEPFDSTRSLPSREAQRGAHVISSDLARADLERAGFEVLRLEPNWARAPDRNSRVFWMIVARRPRA